MKLNKSGKASVANWHPNFRVVDKLPDTKVIRTAFLINAVAVTLLLVVLFALVWRERELADVRAVIGSATEGGLKKDIADNQPKLAQAQKLQGSFAAAEKKMREIEAFVTPSLVASEFLSQIARSFPRLTVINSIDYRGDSVKLQGTLVGASERATVQAKAYVDQLSRDPALAARVGTVRLNKLEREQTTGRLAFEIELVLKPRK
jgi:Tfp pilus assembly protein PilN